LLYSLLKIPAKCAFWIYCRQLKINKKEILKTSGPLLIASNHPNSFLDAIILATLFKRPVYSLARGDAFASTFYDKLLRSLNILPVYRISEGVENLEHNYKTFDDCKKLFRSNGIVLIFSEGRCINEWHLRPLKKGTARLAASSWQDGIPLTVLPLGINYSSFHTFGKNLQLNFGEEITAQQIESDASQGKNLRIFNEDLKQQLEKLVLEIDSSDIIKVKEKFAVKQSLFKKIILAVPAAAGYLIHVPLYLPIKKFTWKRAAHNDHFDSVMMGLLFILYPFYLLLISLLIYFFIGSWWWALTFIVLPFCAWSYVQVKHQFDATN
jgi:1-acyl-sn-glycerol-3-phosphate acyltransferase